MTPSEPPLAAGEASSAPLDALLVVDLGSGALLFADEGAGALFAWGEDPAASPRRLLPQLADLTPRDFVTRVRRGEVEFEIAVRVERLRSGPFNTSDAALVRIRGSERHAPAGEDERIRRRETLWSLIMRRGSAGVEQVRALLREGSAGLGMEAAVLGRIADGEWLVSHATGATAVAAGDALPFARSTARDAVRRAGTFAVMDTAGDAVFRELTPPARSFLSVAFRIGEAQWCVSFTSAQPRAEPFDEEDWSYVELLGDALSHAIERRESDERLQLQAYTDEVTGLPNRLAIARRLDESLAEAERLEAEAAVLFIDLDRFKTVNDSANHAVGDVVLREVAERLRSTLRPEDFIGRQSGDEFVIVLLPVRAREQIEAVAERIAGVLAEPFFNGEQSFQLGASIGVALYPNDERQADRLLAAADAAMYVAKHDGGARIHFSDGRRPDPRPAPGPAPEPAAAEPWPVTGDAGYLVTFEPIYYLRERDICAADVVVRRVDPQRGVLPAGVGLPPESDSRLLRALDEWVLREALTEGRTLASQGFEVAMDVRLAAHDAGIFEALYPAGFTNVDWRRIRIAICARDALEATPAFSAFVEGCARYGLGLVLAGFEGSLGELHAVEALPVFTTRIRCSTIERTAAQPGGVALLEGTLSGAKALGWRMIASGVETQTQRDFVVTLGVDGVQGPYVGHAMTAIDFATWLNSRRESPPNS